MTSKNSVFIFHTKQHTVIQTVPQCACVCEATLLSAQLGIEFETIAALMGLEGEEQQHNTAGRRKECDVCLVAAGCGSLSC